MIIQFWTDLIIILKLLLKQIVIASFLVGFCWNNRSIRRLKLRLLTMVFSCRLISTQLHVNMHLFVVSLVIPWWLAICTHTLVSQKRMHSSINDEVLITVSRLIVCLRPIRISTSQLGPSHSLYLCGTSNNKQKRPYKVCAKLAKYMYMADYMPHVCNGFLEKEGSLIPTFP